MVPNFDCVMPDTCLNHMRMALRNLGQKRLDQLRIPPDKLPHLTKLRARSQKLHHLGCVRASTRTRTRTCARTG
jgi:hypothetical protein